MNASDRSAGLMPPDPVITCVNGALHELKTASVTEVLDVTVELAESGMAMLVATNEMSFASKVTRVILIHVGDR